MRFSSGRRSLVIVGSATALVLAAGPSAIGGPSAATRYVTTNGISSGSCGQAEPCDIVYGTTAAPSGSTVIIEPGTYGSPQSPLPDYLGSDTQNVVYEGAPGKAVPVIYSTKTFGFDNATLSRVEFHTTSEQEGVGGTTMSHVISVDSGDDASACELLGVATDSLCVATGANARAVWYDLGSGSDVVDDATIRGVTGIATGSGGIGIDVEADANVSWNVTATNDIFHGPSADVSVETTTPTSATNLVVDHTAYKTIRHSAYLGTTATITNGAGNRTAAPKLTSGYYEMPGSPTIDAGAADPAAETDVSGAPRRLGPAPDMGAFEFVPLKPTVRSLKVTARHKHSLTITVTVNPGDLATHVMLTATHKKSHHSKTKSVKAATVPIKLAMTIHHLKRHTRYHLRVKATNGKGSATIGGKRAKTR